jgi:CubicO group peptidase (beta-lactamase class C family)
MLLNGGQLDGTRILGRKTVELMEANHLNHMQPPSISADGSEGFGLGGSVRIDLAKGNRLGTVGQFGWAGAASTYFRIDPKERLLMILFQQHFPFDDASTRRFSNLVYQALVD